MLAGLSGRVGGSGGVAGGLRLRGCRRAAAVQLVLVARMRGRWTTSVVVALGSLTTTAVGVAVTLVTVTSDHWPAWLRPLRPVGWWAVLVLMLAAAGLAIWQALRQATSNGDATMIRQAITAAAQEQPLDGFEDEVLIAALDAMFRQASEAARGIVNEAEAILTKAEVCRLDNDDDARAVHVRITEYFENHPRLTTLLDALKVLKGLLEPLRGRAERRRLQLPNTKKARADTVRRFLKSAEAMEKFVDDLFLEIKHLPSRTGLASGPLLSIDEVMKMDHQARVSNGNTVIEAVEKGRSEVQQSRVKQAAAGLALP
jgi:hypothetical protein